VVRFASDASCRIKVVKLAQRVGLTVREIAETFDTLPPEPQPEDWQKIAAQLVTEAEQRVEVLKRATAAMSSGGHLCELDEALAVMALNSLIARSRLWVRCCEVRERPL